jgi:hypothetical protein
MQRTTNIRSTKKPSQKMVKGYESFCRFARSYMSRPILIRSTDDLDLMFCSREECVKPFGSSLHVTGQLGSKEHIDALLFEPAQSLNLTLAALRVNLWVCSLKVAGLPDLSLQLEEVCPECLSDRKKLEGLGGRPLHIISVMGVDQALGVGGLFKHLPFDQ